MRGSLQAYKKVSVDSQLSAASPHKDCSNAYGRRY